LFFAHVRAALTVAIEDRMCQKGIIC
jgi:hypothetical protein